MADAKEEPKKKGGKGKKGKGKENQEKPPPPPELSSEEVAKKLAEERERTGKRASIILHDLRKFMREHATSKGDYKIQGEAWFSMLDRMEKRKMPAPVLSGAIWFCVTEQLKVAEVQALSAIVKCVHPKKVFMKPFVLNENLLVIKHTITQAACGAEHHCNRPLIQSKAASTPKQLRLEGVGCEELFHFGWNAKELVEAGYTAKQIVAACGAGLELTTVLKGLRAAGLTPKDIKDCPGGLRLLKAMPLKSAGYTAFEIRSTGVISAAEMKAVGFTRGVLADAGYTHKELEVAGFEQRLLARSMAVQGFLAVQRNTQNAFLQAAAMKKRSMRQQGGGEGGEGGGEGEGSSVAEEGGEGEGGGGEEEGAASGGGQGARGAGEEDSAIIRS